MCIYIHSHDQLPVGASIASFIKMYQGILHMHTDWQSYALITFPHTLCCPFIVLRTPDFLWVFFFSRRRFCVCTYGLHPFLWFIIFSPPSRIIWSMYSWSIASHRFLASDCLFSHSTQPCPPVVHLYTLVRCTHSHSPRARVTKLPQMLAVPTQVRSWYLMFGDSCNLRRWFE